MYSVGVLGHRAGNFHCDEKELAGKVHKTIEILGFQYGKDLVLNVDCETGVGHFVLESSTTLGIKHHSFLPCPVELIGKDWFEEQRTKLKEYFASSYSTTILSSKYSAQNQKQRDFSLIDCSNFVICFWEGCRQGRTFENINYALTTNKLVLNGLNDLKMISSADTKRRRSAK